MSRRAALALVVAAACHTPRAPEKIATPGPGISIAFYEAGGKAYTVVDDRRFVEVRGGVLVLDHVDPGAALPSLVIEPLGEARDGAPLVVGQCDRQRETRPAPEPAAVIDPDAAELPAASLTIVSPVVHCTAQGGSGKQLVRVLYVSSELAYRAQHEVRVTTGDRAAIATRFAIATPAWGERADVVLFAGMPGQDKPPVELARGQIALDGSTSVLAAPAREVPARVRRVFDGAIRSGVGNGSDPDWGRDSVHAVWAWLELDGSALPPGPIHAYFALPGESPREVDVPAAGREDARTGSRLPLWIEPELRGMRNRSTLAADGTSVVDRLAISVSNTSADTREVWIEEKLRPAKRRTVTGGWPTKPVVGAEIVRMKVTVKPGATERVRFAVSYVF